MNRTLFLLILLAGTIYNAARVIDHFGEDRRATETELALNQKSVTCLIRLEAAEKSGDSAEVERCREESQALLAERKAIRPGVR